MLKMSKSSEREHTQFAYFRLNLCKQTAAVAAPAAVVSLRIRSMPYICMAVYDMCVFMRARSFKLPNVYIYIILIWACLQLFVLIALCVQRISVAVTLLLFICFLLICILFARFLCVIHLQRVSNPTRALVHFLNLFQYASVYVRVCVCVSRCEWTFIRAQCKITMSYIICI